MQPFFIGLRRYIWGVAVHKNSNDEHSEEQKYGYLSRYQSYR